MPADHDLAYLLELRIKLRRNPEARALVDRCLALVAQASEADDAAFEVLELEVRRMADNLALRFGAPAAAQLQ